MSTAGHPLRAVAPAQGPSSFPADHVDQIRDSLAERHKYLDRFRPAALDVEARRIAVYHHHLTGIASQLAGPWSADHIRQMLRGERNKPSLFDSYLAVLPMAEPRTAVAADAAVITRQVGYRVTPEGGTNVTLGGSLVFLLQTFGESLAAVERAREDGRIDSTERPQLIAALEGLARRVADVLEAVRQTAGEGCS